MNTTTDNTSREGGTDSPDTAAGRAERGTAAWEDAARLQRWATADHADFYALAGEVVASLYALDDLAQVLGRQVAGYADTQRTRGRVVYDDTGRIDPMVRLVAAVEALAATRDALATATRAANEFWSAVGHIGTQADSAPSDGTQDDSELSDTEPSDSEASDAGEATS
jgi:hypothetical protein